MPDLGPAYRKTEYGWEPVNAWKPSESPGSIVPMSGTEFLLRQIGETIKLGCPPKAAVKWWLYIWQRLKKRARDAKDL